MKTSTKLLAAGLIIAGGAGLWWATEAGGGRTVDLASLAQTTHVHGLAVDRADASRLLVATHHGLFRVRPDGTAEQISVTQDFMGFTPHPSDPQVLYASGHPAQGGNLGVIVSTDGGKTWAQRARGANGPVDFHQMDVSKADPKIIYGVHGGLQVSRDGGKTWAIAARLPEGVIDLAASARDANTLYLATQSGLLVSNDAGRSWRPGHLLQRPVSMVETSADGSVYAFIVGLGLVKATEPSLNWTTLKKDFGDRYILHLAVDPTDGAKMYAATQHGDVLASADGGRTWRPFGSMEGEAKTGARTQ